MGRAILEREEVRAWETGLRALRQRVAGGSGRREPRQRALAYLKGLLGAVGGGAASVQRDGEQGGELPD